MGKRFKGYCSIEASLVMPMVLFLYLLIILSALFLRSEERRVGKECG